jgi:hypothetical protein
MYKKSYWVTKWKNKNSKKSQSHASDNDSKPSKTKKPRGKQKGAKVNGRNTADHLPIVPETFDFFTTEDSEEIVVDSKAHRSIIKKTSTNMQVSP